MQRVLDRVAAVCAAVLAAAVTYAPLGAVPAKPGVIAARQPDGSVVRVRIIGDEYAHVVLSERGEVLAPDEDGWLCHAALSDDGRVVSSGVRLASGGTGSIALAAAPASPVGLSGAAAQAVRQRALRSRRIRSPYAVTRGAAASRVLTRAQRGDGSSDWPPKTARAVALLVQFPDVKFTYSQSNFKDMLTKSGYSSFGGTGSALDWFNAQYKGATEFTIDVGPVVTVSRRHSWYAQEDSDGIDKAAECVYEACRLSDSSVDFSRYDFVYVFYAGGNSADGSDESAIWPHAWSMSSYYSYTGKTAPDLTFDGVKLDGYAMSSELNMRDAGDISFASIGTFCHEFSHILGQYDLYDTDYEDSGGYSQALRSTSVMCQGSYNNNGATPPNYNAVELELAGLLAPEAISAGAYTLLPLDEERRAVKIAGADEGEYCLVEARKASGWDKYIGGSGMLVYHVDRRSSGNAGYSETYDRQMTPLERWEYNEVNCRPDFQCCEIVSPRDDADDLRKLFWPYGALSTLGPTTSPALAFRSEPAPQFTLKGIKSSAGTVTFTAVSPLAFTVTDAYQDAVILGWEADLSGVEGLSCTLELYRGGELAQRRTVPPYADGKYACTVEGLDEGTGYSALARLSAGGVSYVCTASFETPAYAGNPFIVMGDYKRIPLRVYNAKGATSVEWSVDGNAVSVEADGYYTLPSAGELKAVIDYAGGRRDIICKTLGGQKRR